MLMCMERGIGKHEARSFPLHWFDPEGERIAAMATSCYGLRNSIGHDKGYAKNATKHSLSMRMEVAGMNRTEVVYVIRLLHCCRQEQRIIRAMIGGP